MAISKPVYQGVTYKDDTTGKYASVYLVLGKNDENGSTITDYYWIESSSVGVVNDKRNNKLNGRFDDLAGAIATPPSGYGEITDTTAIYNNKRIWAYTQGFPYRSADSLATTLTEYDDFIAAGANCIMVQVGWDEVFQTYSAQTTNADASWAKPDALIDYIASKTALDGNPMLVRLRIKVCMDDSIHYDLFGATQSSGFYGLSQSAYGSRNYPTRIDAGLGHVSLAYTGVADEGVNQALDFIEKCVDRYYTSLGSQLWDVSVVNTSQFEAGYNYENQHYVTSGDSAPVGKYPELFDYSSYSVDGFKDWITSLSQYDTIAKVNTAWGTSYSTYDDIEPPTPSVGSNATQLNNVFSTARGQDWWLWNYKLVKDFQVACQDIVSTVTSNDVRFFLEWGSCTDEQSIRRMSVNVADMPNYSDMMKAQFGWSESKPDLSLTLDVIRSNYSKKIGTELNSFDMTSQYGATNATEIKNTMVTFGQNCILNGAMDIIFISSKEKPSDFTATLDAMKSLIAYSSNHGGRLDGVKDVYYNLGQILNNQNFLLNTWQSNGGSNGQRINMIQTTDIITPPSGGCPNSIQIYPIAQLCLSDLGWRSNEFNESGPYTIGDNRPQSAFQVNYNENRIKFFLPTHSIDYISSSGTTSKVNWRLIGATDSVVYISNVQLQEYYDSNNPGGPYNNNHPNNYYNLNLPVDAVFYLPLDQDYIIELTTTTSKAVTFLVEQLDPNLQLHKSKLAGSSTASYTIDVSSIQKSSIKTVKVGCNRNSETDSL